jgi:hypothetical protein
VGDIVLKHLKLGLQGGLERCSVGCEILETSFGVIDVFVESQNIAIVHLFHHSQL